MKTKYHMEHFEDEEFGCKCGCGFNSMKDETIDKLAVAREKYNRPMTLTSACRCAIHNRNEGGKPDSSHLYGYAVDISCTHSRDRFLLIVALLAAGFRRIGIAHNFIHADCDPNKPINVAWLY